MIKPYYIITETFGPEWGDMWTKYIQWSGLDHLEEVVTLDKELCPLITDVKNETVKDDEKFYTDPLLFLDPEILQHNKKYINPYIFDSAEIIIEKSKEYKRKNILCVFCDPQSLPIIPASNPPFIFLGYDIVDRLTSNSALTNSGGYPDVFKNDELSEQGLLTTYSRAFEVKTKLKALQREELHGDSNIWAIFRLEK